MAQPDPLVEEASDPASDPERLVELADHGDDAVRRAARRNPSLPEDALRKALLLGAPEAWANPMAPLYMLVWTPRKSDWRPIEDAAESAMGTLWQNPERCSAEGKALLSAKVQEWWGTSEYVFEMMAFLEWWMKIKGDGSPEHRKVAYILIACVRTAPNLTNGDRQALDLLEAWCTNEDDQFHEIIELASSSYVKSTVQFALGIYSNPMISINEMLRVVENMAGKETKIEHEQMLLGVIRQAMPLPPVVD